MIEVKSTWTYMQKQDNVLLKARACVAQHYEYEIWMYDDKKQKTVITDFTG